VDGACPCGITPSTANDDINQVLKDALVVQYFNKEHVDYLYTDKAVVRASKQPIMQDVTMFRAWMKMAPIPCVTGSAPPKQFCENAKSQKCYSEKCLKLKLEESKKPKPSSKAKLAHQIDSKVTTNATDTDGANPSNAIAVAPVQESRVDQKKLSGEKNLNSKAIGNKVTTAQKLKSKEDKNKVMSEKPKTPLTAMSKDKKKPSVGDKLKSKVKKVTKAATTATLESKVARDSKVVATKDDIPETPHTFTCFHILKITSNDGSKYTVKLDSSVKNESECTEMTNNCDQPVNAKTEADGLVANKVITDADNNDGASILERLDSDFEVAHVSERHNYNSDGNVLNYVRSKDVMETGMAQNEYEEDVMGRSEDENDEGDAESEDENDEGDAESEDENDEGDAESTKRAYYFNPESKIWILSSE